MIIRRNAIRAFETTGPIDIYRVAGRRPSMVWVDAEGRIAQPGPDSQRLKELVYWRTCTHAGDQLHERIGGMYLVTPDGGCHPIALCAPSPLEPATAFQHAQAVRDADAARLEELLASGLLVPVSGRKPDGPPSRPGDRLVPAEHALVVDEPPPVPDQPPRASERRPARRRF